MRFNFYTALGIPPYTADQHMIKSAYRKKIKHYHPDSHEVDPELAQDQTRVLNRIYTILSDPVKKYDYDRYLFQTENDPL